MSDLDSTRHRLAERIEQGNLIPVNFSVDPLQKILLDIMAMIKTHEKTMASLARDISRKADHDIIANLTKQVDHCTSETREIQRDLQFQLDHNVSDMRRELNDTNDGLSNEMRVLKSQFDAASAQLKGAQILVDEANKRSEENEQKLRDALNLFDPSTKEALAAEIANLKDSIQNIQREGPVVILPPNESTLSEDHTPHPPSTAPDVSTTGRKSSQSERDAQGDAARLPPLNDDRFSSGWASRRSSGSRRGYSDTESGEHRDSARGPRNDSTRRTDDNRSSRSGRRSYASGPRDLDALSDAVPEGPPPHSKLPDVHDSVVSTDGSVDALGRLLADHIAELHAAVDELRQELFERPDRGTVEGLFEKFKVSLSNIADAVARGHDCERDYARMEDLRRLEARLLSTNPTNEEAAAARRSMACLSCGRPYRTVTGSIHDEETLALLGAAPISHLTNDMKPCFVYGSDHELYYASSPRGKTFVAPPPTSPIKGRAKQ
jgi:hypothetical protein